MPTGRPELDGQRGLGELLRELADGGAALVRQEVRLAKLEATEVASSGVSGERPPHWISTTQATTATMTWMVSFMRPETPSVVCLVTLR